MSLFVKNLKPGLIIIQRLPEQTLFPFLWKKPVQPVDLFISKTLWQWGIIFRAVNIRHKATGLTELWSWPWNKSIHRTILSLCLSLTLSLATPPPFSLSLSLFLSLSLYHSLSIALCQSVSPSD
jgi:hypothetical protein